MPGGNAGSVRAGRAYYELGADQNPLIQGLKKAEGMVKSSVKHVYSAVKGIASRVLSLKGLLASAIAGSGAFLPAKLFADAGNELTDLSRRTGASQAALSALGYAAKQTGSDLHAIAETMVKLRDKEIEAARGSEDAQLAFARLGVNFLQLSTMKPEDQLKLIASRLAAVQNPAIKAALATELLGSADMLPTLDRLGEMEKRAKRLGLVLSDTDAAAAKEFHMEITDVWESLKMLGVEIGAKSAPLLTDLSRHILDIIQKARDWISTNGGLINSTKALWTEVKGQWEKGTAYVKSVWASMTGSAESAWIDTSAKMATIWANMWDGLTNGLLRFLAIFRREWNDAAGWLAKRLIDVQEIAGKANIPGGISAKDANTARNMVDEETKGKNLAINADVALREKQHKDTLSEIEAERVRRQQDLAKRLANGAAGLGNALAAANGDQKGRNKKFRLEELPANRLPLKAMEAAREGIGSAVMHVPGTPGHDVRTVEGFSAVAASLRQQQSPLLGVMQQMFQLQGQQFAEQRRLRQDIDKNLKVRDF